MSFNLASIVNSNEVFLPQRFLIYGVQGIGKSTCASTFEAPIFLRLEDGISNISVPTFGEIPQVMEQVGDALRALINEEHHFKTLVIDSLDWLEPLIWEKVCRNNGIKCIEKIGYGKGYIEADNSWKYFMGLLNELRTKKKMQIVLLAHYEIKGLTPPDSDSYDRYQIKLHKRALALFSEWVDNIFFINYQRRMIEDEKTKKKRAAGEGDRLIYTEERPAFLAKNRWNLPSPIFVGQDTTWKPLHDELAAALGSRYYYPESLKKQPQQDQPQQQSEQQQQQ